jgi:programmed cell death protein 5
MSGNSDEERLEKLRQERLEELQEQAGGSGGGEAQQEAAKQQQEAQQEALLKQHLTDDARQRLNAVEMSKPQFAKKVKQQVAALAQSGRVQGRIDEDQMKQILREMKPEEKSFDIRRR